MPSEQTFHILTQVLFLSNKLNKDKQNTTKITKYNQKNKDKKGCQVAVRSLSQETTSHLAKVKQLRSDTS